MNLTDNQKPEDVQLMKQFFLGILHETLCQKYGNLKVCSDSAKLKFFSFVQCESFYYQYASFWCQVRIHFFFVTYRNSKWQDPYFCFSTLWDKCISCACWLNIFYWSRPSYVYVYNHLFIQTKVVSLKQTLLQPMVPQNFTVWFLFFLCGF